MRSLALLLLLTNIVFLTWQLSLLPWVPWQPSQFIKVSPSPKLPVSKVPQLILLSELDVTNAKATTPANPHVMETKKVPMANNTTKAANLASDPETLKTVVKNTENVVLKTTDEIKDNKPRTDKAASLASDPETPKTVAKDTENVVLKTNDEIKEKKPRTEQPLKTLVANEGEKTSIEKPATNENMVSAEVANRPEEKARPVIAPRAAVTTTNVPLPTPAEGIQAANDSAVPPKPIPIVQSPTTVTCFQAGPYLQAHEAKKAADWLNHQAEVNASVQTRDTPVLTITRVYLPPLESRQAAQRVAQRLSQLGIKDYMIESNNTISLGMFKNPDSVERRKKQLQAKGYQQVKTDEHYDNSTRYWLSVKIRIDSQTILTAFRKNFKGPAPEPVACK